MNPMVAQFLTAILRWALQGVFVFLVTKGILTEDQGAQMMLGFIGSLLTLSWVLWSRYKDRLKFLTGLASNAGTTEKEVEADVKKGVAPSVTLQKDEAPYKTSLK